MRQTRKLAVRAKVFTADDIRRLAAILESQREHHSKNDRGTVQYTVQFDDATSIESNEPEVFENEALAAPARPVAITMRYYGYSTHRTISISLSHGNSTYANSVEVSGEGRGWVRDTFLAIQETIQTVKPQAAWVRRHPTVLLNFIALALGTLGFALLDPVVDFWFHRLHITPKPLPAESPWRIFGVPYFFYPIDYGLRWFAGFGWGAFWIRGWLLNFWPEIEFSFGSPHLQTERLKRERFGAIVTLIILPIVIQIAYDIGKAVLMRK